MKKVMIITGTSRGLGKELFKRFSLCKDFKVHAATLHPRENYREELVDVGMLSSVQKFYYKIQGCKAVEWVLINNASVNIPGRIDSDDFVKSLQDSIRVNIFGSLFMAREFIKQVKRVKRKGVVGKIIQVSSIASSKPVVGRFAYAMTKGAQDVLVETLAEENKDIVVVGLRPGRFKDHTMKGTHKKLREMKLEKVLPVWRGHGCNTEDIFEVMKDIVEYSGPLDSGKIINIGW